MKTPLNNDYTNTTYYAYISVLVLQRSVGTMGTTFKTIVIVNITVMTRSADVTGFRQRRILASI